MNKKLLWVNKRATSFFGEMLSSTNLVKDETVLHTTALARYPERSVTPDYQLAFHCAPAIAGVKPANLISLRKSSWMVMKRHLRNCARPLGDRDVYFYRLAECQKRILLLVYNRELLHKQLARPENRKLLQAYGYAPESMSVGAMLARLAGRVREEGDYPHEIGIFLGYPSADVRGFIDNGGKGFRLCGYWKVYGTPGEAEAIFSVYDHVREFFCRRVLGGEKIHTIQYGGTIQ